METRVLDGDAPETITTLLPGFAETMSHELPADPPVTEALLARLLQRRHGADRIVLAAFDHGRAAGCVKLGIDRSDPNGLGHGSLWVFPSFRRRGVGRMLLAEARAVLRGRGRQGLRVDAPRTAAAEAFATALGGRRVSVNVRGRLALTAEARQRLAGLLATPPGYRVTQWVGRCPDEHVRAYARACGALDDPVIGQARRATATPEDVRAREAEARRVGHQPYVVAAMVADSGQVAGYSSLFVRDSPLADCGETLVLPEHRGRGLATAVKAQVLDWAAQQNPRLRLVQSWSDERNHAIVALNARLGFASDSTWCSYELAV